MRRISLVLGPVLALLALAGCAGTRGACCPPVRVLEDVTPAPEVDPDGPLGRALYRGSDGQPISFDQMVREARCADVVAFGELHGHPVGAEYELRLLQAMAAERRPVALAMEFFERDTQPVLDRYLAGEIDKATLMKEARQSGAYPRTHGPLIDFCKANGIPVIAANAPRPLVTRYRKQDEDYPTYLASLTEEERKTLPRRTSTPDDPYRDRFMAFMGPERGARIFKAQALWDDAMAEAITDFRFMNPCHRVLLVVGGFHVTKHLGTVTKIGHRRHRDRVYVALMDIDGEGNLEWQADDEDAGDAVLRVRPQPKVKRTVKNPHPKS